MLAPSNYHFQQYSLFVDEDIFEQVLNNLSGTAKALIKVNASYQLQSRSRYFPEFDLQNAIARCVIDCDRKTSAAIRDLKQSLQSP